ncbi:hypothetical protein [Undibacterium sp. RuTC16W]|uniref:hypothetical protein n=1 Tax=Undibacterium sp. RuTC16W TaxID=3413048 RepID=UPI003BF1E8CC
MKSVLLDLSQEAKLSKSIRQICYDFKNLRYFDQYGSSCVAMAALLSYLLEKQGFNTKVQACYVVVKNPDRQFFLGYKGYAKTGQVEGHAVCIVDDRILIDFGLENVRKDFDSQFPRAICSGIDMNREQGCVARIHVGEKTTIEWRTDWIPPDIADEYIRQAPLLEPIINNYERYKKNRIAFLVKQLVFQNTKKYEDSLIHI